MARIPRRDFLKLAGGGAALPLVLGDKYPGELVPHVIPPAHVVPGTLATFATTCRECPAGCGMILHHRDGRVIKAEGNPNHPVGKGALCGRGQAALQGLYDPDRLSQVTYREHEHPTWDQAIAALGASIRGAAGHVAILSDLQTGSLAALMERFVGALGSTRLLFYEPFSYQALRQGYHEALGQAVVPRFHPARTELVISFAADFLETWVSPVELAEGFTRMHAYHDGGKGRFVYVGPRLSMTAASADELYLLPPGAERWLAVRLLKTILARGWARADAAALQAAAQKLDDRGGPWLAEERVLELARSFVEAKGSLALAGPTGAMGLAAVETARAAALLNHAAGRTSGSAPAVEIARPHALSHAALRPEVEQFLASLSKRDVLIVHNANPVYAHPGAREHLRRAGTVIYLGYDANETAMLADWVLPVDYPLEAWGDYEPYAGIHSPIQPTMGRLLDTRAAGDLLLAIASAAGQSLAPPDVVTFQDWVRLRWSGLAGRLAPELSAEAFWQRAVRRGYVEEAVAPVELNVQTTPSRSAPSTPQERSSSRLALWAWPSVLLYDGRGANHGWLQEVPDPMTLIAWSSWVDIHPDRARSLEVKDADLLELRSSSGAVYAPARITKDVDPQTVALAFGQGHTALGRHAAYRGANAFALLGGQTPDDSFPLVEVRRFKQRQNPVYTAPTEEQHGRQIVRWAELSSLRRGGKPEEIDIATPEGYHRDKDAYSGRVYHKHRWAMVIDLDRCIGCHACSVACYAENNIPVMGARALSRGREMAWIRVIAYRAPEAAHRTGFLPLPCQHCDAAPCEPVCPVYASVHTDEGLNAQVFNRCVGTRYCSNNCPYKVRRFNWYDPEWPAPLNWQLNPDVTVRCRGVMEKCTFCIQRIRRAEQQARMEGRELHDGEIIPACAQTCPTRTILFGDLLDPRSRVSQLTRGDPRRYQVLRELNTKPAVVYLKRVLRDGEGG